MNTNDPKDDVYQMLSEAGYSDKAIAYFKEKDSMGALDNPDHVTDLTGPCGDTMKISFSMEGDRIKDARMQIMGCPGAVASGCAVAHMTRGMTLEEARHLDLDALYSELEKLPDKKVHCARLAVKTLHKAVDEYAARQEGERPLASGEVS